MVKIVISEVYAFLSCSVLYLSCKVNTRQMSHAWHGIHLSHKKSMKYSGHRKLLCELSNYNLFKDSNKKFFLQGICMEKLYCKLKFIILQKSSVLWFSLHVKTRWYKPVFVIKHNRSSSFKKHILLLIVGQIQYSRLIGFSYD